jgi:mono/diheme cytochrome c family protein
VKRAFVLAAGLALAGTAQAAQKLGEVQAQRSPEQVYSAVCGYCHGQNVGPVIRGRGLPPETIEYIVRHGQNAMPAFRPTEVSPAELKALAVWVEKSAADPKEKGQ